MFIEVVTTITSKIEITDSGIGQIKHAVDIDASEAHGFDSRLAYSAALGGVSSAEKAIKEALGLS